MLSWHRVALAAILAAGVTSAQQDWEAGLSAPKPGARAKAARQLGEAPDGYRYLDRLAPLLEDDAEEVRLAAVQALIRIRAIEAHPLMIQAAADLSPQVQSLAIDGLVDFYVPGYAKAGRMGSILSFASSLKEKFSKPAPELVPAYVDVNPEVIRAVADVVRNGRSEEARANAARAVGVLRGREAIDALLDGVRSRNSMIILESVLALQKLREPSVGPDIVFLLRDLDPDVLEAVIRTVGQLRTSEAVDDLVRIISDTSRDRIREQAIIALAKIPGNGQRELFISYIRHRNDRFRAAAAEGLGRIGTPDDLPLIDELFASEKSQSAKLSLAFAAVSLGQRVRLGYLVDGLNSRMHRMEARPFLVELSRNPAVLASLYVPLSTGSVPQRRHLAFVVGQNGNETSLGYLEELTKDSNDEVAADAIEALRVLRARL